MGVHLSLWHLAYPPTGTRLHDRLLDVDGFVKDASGEPYDVGIHFVQGYDGAVHVIDWTNPAAVGVMREEYARLFATGASVMKVDFGEAAPLDGVYADGTPGTRMHNRYPPLYQAAVHEATERSTGGRVAWVRSGWAGGQRYPIHWAGTRRRTGGSSRPSSTAGSRWVSRATRSGRPTSAGPRSCPRTSC